RSPGPSTLSGHRPHRPETFMTRSTIPDSQRRWLLGEVARWQGEGLIAPDQADRIRQQYETDAEAGTRQRSLFVFALQGMAAFLFGLAVLLLIGFNWADMPRIAKLVTILAVVT